MPKGFQVGDPRAVAAGRKGGQTMRYRKSAEWRAGYHAGWQAKKREAARDKAQAIPARSDP